MVRAWTFLTGTTERVTQASPRIKEQMINEQKIKEHTSVEAVEHRRVERLLLVREVSWRFAAANITNPRVTFKLSSCRKTVTLNRDCNQKRRCSSDRGH